MQMMKNHIKDFAKSLNNESLLILGGTGLFGKTLLPALVREIEEKELEMTLRERKKKKSSRKRQICASARYV